MPFSRSMMSLEAALAGLLIVTPALALTGMPRTVPFSNATTATTKGSPNPTSSNCCFVVQDTITENWWQEYTTVTYYQTMNATYITTLVTPYIDTTITNIVTKVEPINATLSSVNMVGYNPATMMKNNAPQPSQVTGAPFGLNGSQIVTAGVTVQSPAPFWVYSTVKVITVPAVTDKNGQVMCATTSLATPTMVDIYDYAYPSTLSWARVGNYTKPSDIFTISDVNSNAEAYFGGNENHGYVPQTVLDYMTAIPAISSQYPGLANCLPGGPSILHIVICGCAAPTTQGWSPDLTTSTVITVSGGGFFGSSPVAPTLGVNPSPSQAHLATSVMNSSPATKPSPSKQSSAPPPPFSSSNAPPATPSLGPPPPLPSSSNMVVISDSVTVPVNPTLPPVVGSTTTIGRSTFVIIPTVTVIPFPGSITVSNGQTSIVISGPTTIPVNSQISIPGSTTIISGTPFVIVTAPTTIAVPTNKTPPVKIPGSTATISGTPVVIISGPTTIPIASLSGLPTPISGVTTTISGTPVVIIKGPTTIALSSTTAPATPILPGSTTIISGTPVVIFSKPATIPVISGVTISGSTTVLGGSTMVLTTGTASGKTSVIGGTTAVVVSAFQSVTLSPSDATSMPLQVTSRVSTLAVSWDWWLMGIVGLLYAVVF